MNMKKAEKLSQSSWLKMQHAGNVKAKRESHDDDDDDNNNNLLKT